jgi:hypothetical protein
MNTITLYVTGTAIVLALAGMVLWRRTSSNRYPLFVYVIGVAIAWAIVLFAARLTGGPAAFNTLALVCLGFAVGMLAMYIAVHVYKS